MAAPEAFANRLRGRSVAFNICLAAASATARLLAAVVIDELDAPMVRANVGDGRSTAPGPHLSLLCGHLSDFAADLSRAGSPFSRASGRGEARGSKPSDADAGLITVGELDPSRLKRAL
jgi:hypothetical protein